MGRVPGAEGTTEAAVEEQSNQEGSRPRGIYRSPPTHHPHVLQVRAENGHQNLRRQESCTREGPRWSGPSGSRLCGKKSWQSSTKDQKRSCPSGAGCGLAEKRVTPKLLREKRKRPRRRKLRRKKRIMMRMRKKKKRKRKRRKRSNC